MGNKKEVIANNSAKEELKKELETINNIVTRHINKETNALNLATALIELEKMVQERDMIIGRLEARVMALEDGMSFFANDWEQRYGKSIIIPNNNEINAFKK